MNTKAYVTEVYVIHNNAAMIQKLILHEIILHRFSFAYVDASTTDITHACVTDAYVAETHVTKGLLLQILKLNMPIPHIFLSKRLII